MNACSSRLGVFAAAVLFAIAVSIGPAAAVGDDGTRGPGAGGAPAKGESKGKKSSKKKKKQAELHERYLHARALILDGQYAAGIAALRALKHDDDPEVANYVGYASSKLKRYDDAKVWYEKALAADPNHVRTWSYYGMWHAEQGNLLKAHDHLEKVRLICGSTECKEYRDLRGVLEGTVSY